MESVASKVLIACRLQGVALNMTVNGKDYVVPMVLEEPSVVAAVGNIARMIRPSGFTATSDDPIMVNMPPPPPDTSVLSCSTCLEPVCNDVNAHSLPHSRRAPTEQAAINTVVDMARLWSGQLIMQRTMIYRYIDT